MPRKLRVEYPGAIYHLMNRGDRREPIFKDDEDRKLFLTTLGECCGKTDWQVHAWCLMLNHFHLVVETPRANLVAGIKWFLGTYTSRFNRRHKLFGHLFSGRYKALVVDGSGNGYLKTVCDYVHLNPSRAKLLGVEEPLKAFAWSSYPDYLKAPAKRPWWLRVNRLLGEHRIAKDSAFGRAFWREGISEGVARAGGRRGGGVPLRGGTAGERGAEGARDCGDGIEAARVDGGGSEASAEGRREEGAHCAAVAGGDGDDVEMDRRGVADGSEFSIRQLSAGDRLEIVQIVAGG